MKVVICIFFFVLGALCSEVELVQVIHFMRHGARTPNSFEYKPQQYLEKQGELTLLGLLQGYLTGRELRERYIEKTRFLSSELKPNEIYIKSSYKSRTLGTATAFLNGLYPQAEGKTLNNPYNILGHEAIPLRTKHREIKPEDLLNFTINEEWARTHIDVASKEMDHFYHAYKNGNCPLAEFLIDQHLLTPEALEAEEFFTTNLYPTMEWQINSVLGEEKINKELLNIKKAKKILDNFRCNSFHKQDHPKFNNLTVALLKALMQYQVYVATFKEEFVRNVASSRIFESMLNFTQKIVTDQANTPKFVLYSGHDTNLEPMLYNLLSQDEILSREEYTIIPFASVLSLHVYKEKIEGRIDHFVEITFNDRALPLDWCSGTKCPLSTFHEKLQKHIILDLINSCAHQDATTLP